MYRKITALGTGQDGFRRFLIGCMAVGFVALLLAGAGAVWTTLRNADHTAWVNHTYEVELAINRASLLIEQGETTRRGYLLTRKPVYLDSYATARAQLPAALRRVATLTRDNAVQQRNIAELTRLTDDLGHQRDRTIALMQAGQAEAAVVVFGGETSARRMIGIRELAKRMIAEERRLLVVRDASQRGSVRLFYAALIVAGVLVVLVAIVSWLTISRYTAELGASRDAIRDFADTLEDQVAERTADLSRANEEIQRFAYIVSHDLRSPLVNVMGFTAELEGATAIIGELIDRAERHSPDIVTEDARLAAREDLPEAIGFIRTSTQKMDRLINAILKLSREGRRVIAAEPLDLDAMIEGIGASLAQQLDKGAATLTTERPLPTLVSDRLAVEQIFSNLIENAVKYLDPARPGRIVVRGRQAGQRITFEVEDNGRGIAASDHARVFDLFRRSGLQNQPGEGIGLAHVRALAYRLGGVIDVSSELGRGSTFRLTLPLAYTEPTGPDSRATPK